MTKFSREVSASLQRAATVEGIELISLDNRYNAKIAQHNADLLVREKWTCSSSSKAIRRLLRLSGQSIAKPAFP